MSKFIQPVSMRVTQEQYERDLREPLLAMGYEEVVITSFSRYTILVSNCGGEKGVLSNTLEEGKDDYDRHFIPEYNPEYFLAVAAMTKINYGIKGEWWKYLYRGCVNFDLNKLYISQKPLNEMFALIDKRGEGNGYQSKNLQYFRKATLPDLINHFEPKINNKKTMTKLTQQEKDTLAKLITKDNEAIFEKIGVKKDKNPIGVLQSDSHAKEEIAKYIVAAEMTPSIIGKKELTSRAFVMCPNYGAFYKFVLHEKDGLQVLAIEEK